MTALTLTSPDSTRRLSPNAVASGGRLTTLSRQTGAELRKLLRMPDFVAPVVILPVILYALFAGPNLAFTTDAGQPIGPYLTASFTTYGVLGIVLFAFGEAVASERGMGWLRLVRATPLPGWAFIGAKLLAGIALIGTFLLVMIPASTALGGGVTPPEWVRLGLTVALGCLALAPIGFLVGFLARPSAAGAVALLTYLPLSFASGMWTPVESLPAPVQAIAPYLPTYHLNALAHAAVGVPTPDILLHVAWVAGTFVVAGGLAVVAYRRLVGRQFA